MTKIMRRLSMLALLAFGAMAQVNKSNITGFVRDSSGGAMVGVNVKITNEGTSIGREAKTDATGAYRFLLVDAGSYRLDVEQTGFKKFVRTGIELTAGETITVDVPMEVGATTESVTVQAEAAQLRTETSALGSSLGERAITQLPLQGRNPYVYLSLSAGIQYNGDYSWLNPWDVAGPSTFSASGSSARAEFLLDGIPNMRISDVSFSPSPDAVGEMRAQTNAYDAEYGHSSAAFINVTTKPGTNDLHGSVYWYHQDDHLNAATFFNNQQRTKKSKSLKNTFGFAVSGPVYIPKVINGHDKLFFFLDYEGTRSPSSGLSPIVVPSLLERTGDFSQTVDKSGNKIVIYDPFSTVASGSGYVRTPFSSNVIPNNSQYRDAVGAFMASQFPAPNKTIVPGTLENYNRSSRDKLFWNSIATRADYNFTPLHTLFLRFGWNHRTSPSGIATFFPNNKIYSDPADIFHRRNIAAGAGYTWVRSARTVIDFRLGFTRGTESNYIFSEGMDLTTVGFPASFAKSVIYGVMPFMRMSPADVFTCSTCQLPNNLRINQYNPMANVHTIRGRHTIKFGWRSSVAQRDDFRPERAGGQFTFGRAFTQGPDPTKSSSLSGNSFAALLLGMPDNGYADIKVQPTLQTPYHSFYVQDDWKIMDRLTLNLGLRLEHEGGTTDRYNNLNSGYDFGVASPIQEAVQANYAKNPIPELAAISVRGGLGFVNVGGAPRSNLSLPALMYAPRVGFAYRVTNFMVFRGGYGVFIAPNNDTGFQQFGFNTTTAMVTSLDNNLTAYDRLANPFPSGLSRPLGAKGGLLTSVGQSITAASAPIGSVPNFKDGLAQQFSFGFQFVLPWSVSVETSYVGNLSQRLTINNRKVNEIPNAALAYGNRLNAKVTNPFYGVVTDPTSILSQPQVAVQQLLRPYPQFTGITQVLLPYGRSNYNSLQVQVSKRLSHGVQLGAAYTFSKYMQAISYLNNNDAKPEHVISDFDRPQHLVLNGLWDLPFGPGRPLFNSPNKVIKRIAEGWQINWIATFQSGQALSIGSARWTGKKGNDLHTVFSWFDTTPFSSQLPFTLLSMSSRLGGLRGPGINRVDFTFQKHFSIYERLSWTIQADFYNAFNKAIFANPNTSVTSTSFGKVTGLTMNPRNIQLSARVTF